MVVDFTSKDAVEKAVNDRIAKLSDEEKRELIQQARDEDTFDLQTQRSDEEMLQIAVKYELFQDQD